jgi:hypothetical protein
MCIGVSGSIKVSDTGTAALVAYRDFIAFWKSYSFFSFPPMTMGSATSIIYGFCSPAMTFSFIDALDLSIVSLLFAI